MTRRSEMLMPADMSRRQVIFVGITVFLSTVSCVAWLLWTIYNA